MKTVEESVIQLCRGKVLWSLFGRKIQPELTDNETFTLDDKDFNKLLKKLGFKEKVQ